MGDFDNFFDSVCHWNYSSFGFSLQNKAPQEPLLGSTPVSTVVQMSGSSAKTMVIDKSKSSKEKCLLASVLALSIFCGVLVLMLLSSKGQSCYGKKFNMCLEIIRHFQKTNLHWGNRNQSTLNLINCITET